MKCTSHKNKNLFLEIIFHTILIKLLGDIHNYRILIVMAAETTNLSNKVQLTMLIRWVDEVFKMNEG